MARVTIRMAGEAIFMLLHLSISQFTLVDQLELEFGPGTSALTGETGAGKSITLDALGLALGDRGNAELVRAGSPRADIHATFDIGDHPSALAWLQERTGESVQLWGFYAAPPTDVTTVDVEIGGLGKVESTPITN